MSPKSSVSDKKSDLDKKSLPRIDGTIDWNFHNKDTQYLTHAIHRYSGKFIPQIARRAIQETTQPGDIILDPYCGSGTSLLECSLHKRRSIGIDLNPLAVLISKVKTTPIKKKILDRFLYEIEEYLNPLTKQGLGQSLFLNTANGLRDANKEAQSDSRWTDPWYQKWFQENILIELIIIHRKISQESDINYRNLGFIAFSDVLRKSSNASSSYPNVMFDKKKKNVPPVTSRFLKRLREIIDSVAQLEYSIDKEYLPEVLQGDARLMPIDSESVDAIISHPPYVGSIPYAEYGVLSLVWLGHNPKDLDNKLTGGKRQSARVLERFTEGFEDMISESYRVLKSKGKLFLLLGYPTVKGKKVALPELAKNIAESKNFELDSLYFREGKNRRANLMNEEALLFFQKK